jgi:hypothetical protein
LKDPILVGSISDRRQKIFEREEISSARSADRDENWPRVGSEIVSVTQSAIGDEIGVERVEHKNFFFRNVGTYSSVTLFEAATF